MIIQKRIFRRMDLRLRNKRGYFIECSYFEAQNQKNPVPCVIFLHANGCSRVEAMEYLESIASNGMNLFCFDFSGSGKSEGPHCSLGWFEQDDLECVIDYLSSTGNVSRIGVWGRSMGAITALLYAKRDPRITCLVLDSPFASFKQFAKEFANERGSIPGFVTLAALAILRNSVKSRANFDINDLEPLKEAPLIKIPALFAHADDDTFIHPRHSIQLYESYGGRQKKHLKFAGDHNTQRPNTLKAKMAEFLKQYLFAPSSEKKASQALADKKIESKRAAVHAKTVCELSSVKFNFSWTNDQEIATQKNCVKDARASYQPQSKRGINRYIESKSHYEDIPTENCPNSPNLTSIASTARPSLQINEKFKQRRLSDELEEYFDGTVVNTTTSLQSFSSVPNIQVPNNFAAKKPSLSSNNIDLPYSKSICSGDTEVLPKPTTKIIGLLKSQMATQKDVKSLSQKISMNSREKETAFAGVPQEVKSTTILQKVLGPQPTSMPDLSKNTQAGKHRAPDQEISPNVLTYQSVLQKNSTSLILSSDNTSNYISKSIQKTERHQEAKISQPDSKYSYSAKTSLSQRYIPGMFCHQNSRIQENCIKL